MKLSQLLQKYADIGDVPDWITDPETESEPLPSKIEDWPEDWQEAYEERAAILEYEAGLSRTEAEQMAESSQRDRFLAQRQLTE